MGYWIDENTFQFESEAEMALSLGIDIETIEGDYREAYQHMNKFWNDLVIENKIQNDRKD